MKIFIALKSAIVRLPRIWKGALIFWFMMFMLVSLLAVPMKGVLKSGFGRSMIIEKLKDGINVEVFSDLGATLTSLFSFFTAGFLLILLSGFVINNFFTAGFFYYSKQGPGTFSMSEFFSESVKKFWSFLIISVIMHLIFLFLTVLVIVLPIAIVSQSDTPGEGTLFKACVILFSIFILLLMVLLLVADYARAWQVTQEKNLCFKAIGFGFRQTFRTFGSSYTLMIILLIVQLISGGLSFKFISGFMPTTGGGIFLLFILSQFLFFIKIMLKVWRYASVTELMQLENNNVSESISPHGFI